MKMAEEGFGLKVSDMDKYGRYVAIGLIIIGIVVVFLKVIHL
jgi:hypothetical protein